MKKFPILLCLLLSSISVFSQNKKEQIQFLQGRLDTLKAILSTERSAHSGELAQLRSKLTDLDKQINSLKNQLQELKANDAQSKAQLLKLKSNCEKDAQEIVQLQSILQWKTDSLKLFLPKYKSVRIGKQVWMTENLNVDKFSNGNQIPEVRDAAAWRAAGESGKPAWCYYKNDPKYGIKYGKLYNWYAVADPRQLCPTGWHIPSEDEWMILTDFLGASNINDWETTIAKMKSNNGWLYDDDYHAPGNGNNESGFSGLPAGFRSENVDYGIGYISIWWSSTDRAGGVALDWLLNPPNVVGGMSRIYIENSHGLSVRCLRD